LTERHITYLLESEPPRPLAAAKYLLLLARRATKNLYSSLEGKSPYQLFVDFLELVEKYAEDVGMDEDETLALQESMGQIQEAVDGEGEGSEEVPEGEEAASVSGRLMRIAGPPIPTESGVIHKPVAVKKAEKDTDTDVLENEDTDPSNPRLLNVEGIVHTDGLSVYKDQAGRLWTGLATYWIKRGEFDRATATFEKGLATVLMPSSLKP
jgi:pre-mRNA-splicing factor SYF1